MTNQQKGTELQSVPCPNKVDRLSTNATAVVHTKENKSARSTLLHVASYQLDNSFLLHLCTFLPGVPGIPSFVSCFHICQNTLTVFPSSHPQTNLPSAKAFSANLRSSLQRSETRTFTGNRSILYTEGRQVLNFTLFLRLQQDYRWQ